MKNLVMLPVLFSLLVAQAAARNPPQDQGIEAQRSVSLHERPSKENCTLIQLSGELKRNEKYVHALPTNLEFRLLPSPQGWSISIGRPGDTAEDYVKIATPPYHGVNEAVIEAWHFRNADNTGPNDGGVTAPTDVRDFSFVLTRAEYLRFSDAINTLSENDRSTTKQRDTATNFLVGAPRQDGLLNITDMKLGGLEKGARPWFDSMKFNVDLCFPLRAGPASPKNNSPPKKNP